VLTVVVSFSNVPAKVEVFRKEIAKRRAGTVFLEVWRVCAHPLTDLTFV